MPRQKTGSIVKRKDRPGLWVRLPYKDEFGKQHVIQRKVENRTEGGKLLKSLMREIEQHGVKIVDGDRMTFSQLLSEYEKRKVFAPVYKGETKVAGMRSHKSVKSRLNLLAKHFGKRLIKTITHADVEKFRFQRLTTKIGEGKKNQGEELKVTSVNRELQLMRAILNFARRQGWLSRNPFEMGDSLISAAEEKRRSRILTRSEETRLLAACVKERAHLRPLVIVAADTGMRRGELLKLRWPDVDFISRLITVQAMNSKTARKREIGMTGRVYEELFKLSEAAPPDCAETVFGLTDFKRSWETAKGFAGIEDFHFHDLRHTAGTRMVEAGMAPAEVMRVLGHTTLAAVNVYINANAETATRAAAALDGWHGLETEPEKPELIN